MADRRPPGFPLASCSRKGVGGSPREPMDVVLDATTELLTERPYADISTTLIATRCRWTPAELKARYGSLDAVIANVYLRRLRTLPLAVDSTIDVISRLSAQVQQVACLFADRPTLSRACVIALMSYDDPAMIAVRQEISAELRRRIVATVGYGAWPEVHDAIETVVCGALMQVATGMVSYHTMIDNVETAFAMVLPNL